MVMIYFKKRNLAGVVGHTVIPAMRWEDCSSRLAHRETARHYLKNNPGMVTHPCNSKYTGGQGRRSVVSGHPRQKHEILPAK
jgi:hypothetical protein